MLRVMQAVPAHLELLDDSVALLHDLHRAGHRLVFLSNMPLAYLDHAQRQLDRLGVFETGLYSSRIGMVKPMPEIFAHAEAMFGVAGGRLHLLRRQRGQCARSRPSAAGRPASSAARSRPAPTWALGVTLSSTTARSA